MEHRLGSPFREVTERIAEAAPPADRPGESVSTVRAALVLESMAGSRKVPVGAMPLRVGSDGACDLVLRQEGVMPEHAMAWIRDDVMVLHVIHQHATCLVNGEPMSWAVLEDGDEVRFGEARLTVSLSS